MKIPDRHHHPIDLLADVNAVVSGFALYPQLFRAVTDPSSRAGLAPLTFVIICATQFVWFGYALHRQNIPIIITSVLSGTASALLVFFSFAR